MDGYEISLPRAALGIVAGTITGASLVTLALLWSPPRDAQLLLTLQEVSAMFICASIVWAAGLLIFAPVPWALLHYYRWRSWGSAVALGIVLTFIVSFCASTYGFGLKIPPDLTWAGSPGGPIVLDGRLTPHGWLEAFQLALVFSVSGAFVGFVVWRTAYRRVSHLEETGKDLSDALHLP